MHSKYGNIWITEHARIRYLERFHGKRFSEDADARDYADENRIDLNNEMIDKINLSKEDNSYKNNHNYMAYLYEKHGYDAKFRMLLYSGDDALLLFLIVILDGKQTMVTCMDAGGGNIWFLATKKKFRHK